MIVWGCAINGGGQMLDTLFTLLVDRGFGLPVLFLLALLGRFRLTLDVTRTADGLTWRVTLTV